MRLLLIGGTGAIGRATARALRGQDKTVVGFSRTASDADRGPHVIGNRGDPDAVLAAIRSHAIDRVIDFVAYTEAESRSLIQRIDGAVERYVLISSCDVYRNYGLLHRREQGEPVRTSLTEDAPLRTSRYPYRGAKARAADDRRRWMDDYDKIPIEEAAQAMAGDWTILRLPMVYGPGDKQRRFAWIAGPILARSPEISAGRAWLDWVASYGFVDTIGAQIGALTLAEAGRRCIYNLGDHPAVDHRVWIDRFAAETGWAGRIRALDETPEPLAGLDLTVPLAVDCGRSLRDAAVDRVPIVQAVRATVADEAERGH